MIRPVKVLAGVPEFPVSRYALRHLDLESASRGIRLFSRRPMRPA